MDIEQKKNRLVSWKETHRGGIAALQKDLTNVESASRLYKLFQMSVVPALLQTPSYIEWVMANVEPDFSPSRHLSNAVSHRLRRQAILENPNKLFQFLIYEPALTRTLSGSVRKQQIEHLKEMAKRDNISIGLVPLEGKPQVVPINSFIIYDDVFVTVVTVSERLELVEALDIGMYLKNFETLKRGALWDEDLNKFLDELTSR